MREFLKRYQLDIARGLFAGLYFLGVLISCAAFFGAKERTFWHIGFLILGAYFAVRCYQELTGKETIT